MVDPIELYLGFDRAFFRLQRFDTMGAEAEADIEATASRYRSLLEGNRRDVNRALANGIRPEELPAGFYEGLNKLVPLEHRHETVSHVKAGGLGASKASTILVLNRLAEAQAKCVGGRTAIHLVRLIYPEEYDAHWSQLLVGNLAGKLSNTFCSEFGRAYLRYVGGLDPENELGALEITERISSEGEGVFVFWTIAPYVYADLRQRGNDANRSMGKIFDWIKEAEKGHDFYPQHIELGEPFGIYTFGDNTLGYDERMPTHLRSRLVSKVVAREL